MNAVTYFTTECFHDSLGGGERASLALHLRTSEAAQLLGVAPNTLRSWHERFAFPTTRHAATGNRLFRFSEVIALRKALEADQSIITAIAQARAGQLDFGAEWMRLADVNNTQLTVG